MWGTFVESELEGAGAGGKTTDDTNRRRQAKFVELMTDPEERTQLKGRFRDPAGLVARTG